MRPRIRSTADVLRSWLLGLPRYCKRTILVLLDFALLSSVLWGAMSVRYGAPYMPPNWPTTLLLFAGPALAVGTIGYLGLYRVVTRYFGYQGNSRIILGVLISVVVWALLVFMSGQLGVPRSVIIAYGIVGGIAISTSRHMAGWILKTAGIELPMAKSLAERKAVLIYGAGQTGVELLEALRRSGDRDTAGFIDAAPSLWGQYVSGVKVYRPDKLGGLIEREEIKEVLLALPEGQRREKRAILQALEQFPVVVKILPGMDELASGRVSVSDLRPVTVTDLLGRDAVPPNVDLLARSTRGKSILVTGAGGSVGSELVRQILKQEPRRIVLLEVSEAALYEIDMDVSETLRTFKAGVHRPEILAVLGSVLDAGLIGETIQQYDIQTIYHAAAYKHVPIVEHNPVAGLTNNVFGVAVVAEQARAAGVERVVLISTDKAVRPTNIMGASKRLSELILQARASEGPDTIFTMVRFGNVLDSSGSVVRRFRQQIKNGGPVTVTHPEMTRYFMSIPEAAELVIQAGSMGKGGDVFVLEMGEPVRIADLARLMIKLVGLDVKSELHPDGDIEISYTGLRPGEKLYEELLIGANTTGTEHPRIMRSHEPFLPPAELESELETLRVAMIARDYQTMQSVLKRTVEGYRPGGDTPVSVSPEAGRMAPTPTLH